MSTLTIDFISSLDSFGTAEGWPGLWGMAGPEYLDYIGVKTEQVTLMGATTYRELAGYAAEVPDEPGLAAITAAPKVVFSATLTTPLEWANTELVTRDAVEAVTELKRRESRPLCTLGSIKLCRSLLQARLVDRLRIVVFPVINGASGQARLFEGYPDLQLDLVDSRLFDGQLQLLEYIPTVLDGPPGVES